MLKGGDKIADNEETTSYQGLFRHWGNPLLCPQDVYTHDQMNTITLVFLHLLLEVTTQGQIT